MTFSKRQKILKYSTFHYLYIVKKYIYNYYYYFIICNKIYIYIILNELGMLCNVCQYIIKYIYINNIIKYINNN